MQSVLVIRKHPTTRELILSLRTQRKRGKFDYNNFFIVTKKMARSIVAGSNGSIKCDEGVVLRSEGVKAMKLRVSLYFRADPSHMPWLLYADPVDSEGRVTQGSSGTKMLGAICGDDYKLLRRYYSLHVKLDPAGDDREEIARQIGNAGAHILLLTEHMAAINTAETNWYRQAQQDAADQ